MPRGHISKNHLTIHWPGEEPIVYKPGDLVPPHIELDRMAERLKGGARYRRDRCAGSVPISLS